MTRKRGNIAKPTYPPATDNQGNDLHQYMSM